MAYDCYFASFEQSYSFSLQDVISKTLKKNRIVAAHTHVHNGFLFLLPKQPKNDAHEYLKTLKATFEEHGIALTEEQQQAYKTMYAKTTEKTFEITEIEQTLRAKGIFESYTIEQVPMQLEYVFWVTKDQHSDILLRSTKEHLQAAFQELCEYLTEEHPYTTYDLTSIHLHYKTTKGYIGTGEQYRFRKPLAIRDLLIPNEIDYLTYL